MTPDEKLWEEYADLVSETMPWWQFEKALDKALQLQREACANAALNHLLTINLRVTGLSNAILNAEVKV